MKVGIITFTYGQNFGNKLQNYALLQVLKTFRGFDVYTLRNFDITTQGTIVTRFKKIAKLVLGLKGERLKYKKQKVFNRFNAEYLDYYSIPLTTANYEKLQDFDVLVCGSDQIWNPKFNKDINMFSGGFARNAKRISYAASIGLSVLPKEVEDKWKESWMTMDAIGVREESAVNLVKALTGRDAQLQIDPTMLLTEADWVTFEKKPNRKIPEKYLLTYFICEMTGELREKVAGFASELGCEVVSLNDIQHGEWYDISPNEFVYLIHHAKYVIADSFHATVFSIIFGKPFHCLQRVNANHSDKQGSRLETLLGYFGLQERFGYSKPFDKKGVDQMKIDSILANMKNKSMDSLTRMLESEER